jgi:hypothetical protein
MFWWLTNGMGAMHRFFHEKRAELILLGVIGVTWCLTAIYVF